LTEFIAFSNIKEHFGHTFAPPAITNNGLNESVQESISNKHTARKTFTSRKKYIHPPP